MNKDKVKPKKVTEKPKKPKKVTEKPKKPKKVAEKPKKPEKNKPVVKTKIKQNQNKISVVYIKNKSDTDFGYDKKINKVINQLKEQNKSFDSNLRFGWQNN